MSKQIKIKESTKLASAVLSRYETFDKFLTTLLLNLYKSSKTMSKSPIVGKRVLRVTFPTHVVDIALVRAMRHVGILDQGQASEREVLAQNKSLIGAHIGEQKTLMLGLYSMYNGKINLPEIGEIKFRFVHYEEGSKIPAASLRKRKIQHNPKTTIEVNSETTAESVISV